jgi:hypothetical protein
VYLCIGFNPKQIKNMNDLELQMDIYKTLRVEDDAEYIQVLRIEEAIRQNDFASVAQQVRTLKEEMESGQESEMLSRLRALMFLIFDIYREGFSSQDDRMHKVREFSAHIDEIAYLMSIQSKFTREYVEKHIWPEAWEQVRSVYEDGRYKVPKILSWEDVFETDCFPINE